MVKPLEGSLTLHHWQRLAMPHLGNVLEEDLTGIAVKGAASLMPPCVPVTTGDFAAIDSGMDLPAPSRKSEGAENDNQATEADSFADESLRFDNTDGGMPSFPFEDTRTHHTLTDSTILHPDDHRKVADVQLVSSYSGGDPQLYSGFSDAGSIHPDDSASMMSERPQSRMSINSLDDFGSIGDLSISGSHYGSHYGSLRRHRGRFGGGGRMTYAGDIGLARVLNERHIGGYMGASTLSLNQDSGSPSEAGDVVRGRMGDVGCSLTPSVISTPACERSFSPTGTPLNSPTQTPPGTPPPEKKDHQPEESGIVVGFFSALKAALYGEQQKEAQSTLRRQHHRKSISKRGGLKKFGILERVEEVGVENLLSASPLPDSGSSRGSSISRVNSYDELEAILPGSLTVNTGRDVSVRPKHQSLTIHQEDERSATVGQLQPPTFSMFGRPSLDPRALGSLPPTVGSLGGIGGSGAVMGGRGPGRMMGMVGPGERKPAMPAGALGVPATPGTGAISRGVRTDLGSVPIVAVTTEEEKQQPAGFIGSIANVFFGRKGGLL